MSNCRFDFKKIIIASGSIALVLVYSVVEGVSYQSVGYRHFHGKLSPHRLQALQNEFEERHGVDATPDDLRLFALKKTAEALHFVLRYDNQTNPNKILARGGAHCSMYAMVYTSIFNQLAETRYWKSTCHVAVARVHLFGVDLHQFADSRFFATHDFCVIRNANGVEAVDPVVFDYFRATTVQLRP